MRDDVRLRGLGGLCVLALLAWLGCGDARSGPAQRLEVEILGHGYEPATLRIEVGDVVRFVNRDDKTQSARDDPTGRIPGSPQPGKTAHDGSEINHTSELGFATHSLFPGEWQKVVFEDPGTYEYESDFDSRLRGTIVVVPRR